MSANRQRIGRAGEAEARRRLESQGYNILAANWRTKQGEIDLIARDGHRLVFIEVRSRSSASGAKYGTPAESVDLRKKRRLRLLAQKYMQLTSQQHASVRFDVIAVTIGDEDDITDYKHYEAAF